ncbi:MAG: NAD(P)H-binding protein [Deltaproteobacteria bacterium]|nr:NAD(P)H-binding protein [Deltaproteobacteria bacterium]
MKCILIGGSGQVGGAVARALIGSDACHGLTMIGRRKVAEFENMPKVTQVVADTVAPGFEDAVKSAAIGHDVAISCLGIGSGTNRMTEAEMMAVEVTLAGQFARGAKAAGIENFLLLTAVGVSEESATSRVRYLRVLGKKLITVRDAGFARLAVFKPGMIVGNAHTPKWMTVFTALIPDATGWGNISQKDLAQSFAAHLETKLATQTDPVVYYGNKEMKQLVANAVM